MYAIKLRAPKDIMLICFLCNSLLTDFVIPVHYSKVQKTLLFVNQSNANILCPDCSAKFEFEGTIDHQEKI
jgi:hypothetical protein